jgi:hypothetical protein
VWPFRITRNYLALANKARRRRVPAFRRDTVGYSIPAAAEALNMPESIIRRAADRHEVEVVVFAGLRRIPPAEVARLRKLFGKETSPQRSPE